MKDLRFYVDEDVYKILRKMAVDEGMMFRPFLTKYLSEKTKNQNKAHDAEGDNQ